VTAMTLPSDPEYIPACDNPRVLALQEYQDLLKSNTDPYAKYSRNESLIQLLEEYAQ
jgi:hypothetical protein